jgi:DNA-binding beta-propeller fold protein YncE
MKTAFSSGLGSVSLLCSLLTALAAAHPETLDSASVARPGELAVEECGAANDLAPSALAATPDGKRLFIACSTANQVAEFDLDLGRVSVWLPVPPTPVGLVVARDGLRLYVTCAAPQSTVCIVNVPEHTIMAKIPLGHTAMARLCLAALNGGALAPGG